MLSLEIVQVILEVWRDDTLCPISSSCIQGSSSQICQFVDILTNSGYGHGPRPVVIHVTHAESESLNFGGRLEDLIMDDVVGRWAHCLSVSRFLSHQEKVISLRQCNGVVHDCSRRWVAIIVSQSGQNSCISPLCDDNKQKLRRGLSNALVVLLQRFLFIKILNNC